MTPIPATITVNFTANYTGFHRVCYRINGAGPYTCVNVNCAGGGTACSAIIPVSVDQETCDPVTFDGYVQATCQDIASLTDRIPFSIVFTPVPSCKRWVATCDSVPLLSIDVTLGGSGYDPLNVPNVNITGGGGVGATATAVVGSGAITGLFPLASTGSGYAPAGTYTNVPLTGGTGIGVQATISVNMLGEASVITITNPGTGYTEGDNLSASDANLGNSGLGAGFQVTAHSDYGKVIQVILNTTGSGFTIVPGVSIDPPNAGVTATASANLGYCSAFAAPACGSPTGLNVPGNVLQPGSQVALCKKGIAPVLPTEYSVVENGSCLCDCEQVTINVSGLAGSITYYANLCNGDFVTGTITAGNQVVACVVSGSYGYSIASGTPIVSITTQACP